MSRKRIPLNQNGCTADFRIGVPFEQNLQITVITFLISYWNTVVPDRKKHTNICKKENGSFVKFGEVLSYGFDYKRIEKENLPLYVEMVESDALDQRDDFAIIWNSIVERVQVMSEDEQIELFVALEESEINVIPESVKFLLFYNQLLKPNWLSITFVINSGIF